MEEQSQAQTPIDPVTSPPQTQLSTRPVWKYLTFTLIIVLLLLGAGFIYLAIQNHLLKQVINSTPQTSVPLYNDQNTDISQNPSQDNPAPSQSPTPSPSSDWDVYTNLAYNLSFKYPPGGVLTEGKNLTTNRVFARIIQVIYQDNQFELFIRDNDEHLNLDEYIQKYGGSYPQAENPQSGQVYTNQQIGHLTGTHIIFPNAVRSQLDYISPSEHFYFLHNGSVYWLRLTENKADSLSEASQNVFKQIISSFSIHQDYAKPYPVH